MGQHTRVRAAQAAFKAELRRDEKMWRGLPKLFLLPRDCLMKPSFEWGHVELIAAAMQTWPHEGACREAHGRMLCNYFTRARKVPDGRWGMACSGAGEWPIIRLAHFISLRHKELRQALEADDVAEVAPLTLQQQVESLV